MFPQSLEPLINEFIQMKKDRKQYSDADSFKTSLNRFSRYIISKPYIQSIRMIDRKDIEDYIEYLNTVEYNSKRVRYRNNFVYRNLRGLNKFFEYLTAITVEENSDFVPQSNLIRRDDFPSPNRRGVKHFPKWFDNLLLEEIEKITDNKILSNKFKTILLLLYFTGMRIYDLCTLEQDCLFKKMNRNWIRIFSNKTKMYYEIPINDRLYNAILNYKSINKKSLEKIDECKHPTTGANVRFLFTPNYDAKTYRVTLAKKIKKFNNNIIKLAAEKDYPVDDLEGIALTSHKFRHNVAIKLTRAGADPLLVAEFLGHSDLSMAQAYIQEDENEISEVMDELRESGVLELDGEELSEEILIIDKRSIMTSNEIVNKVVTGWCTNFNGKSICDENPYKCWLCENLKPDYNNDKYIDFLNTQLNIHKELKERNEGLGFIKAMEVEVSIINKINIFINEVKSYGK